MDAMRRDKGLAHSSYPGRSSPTPRGLHPTKSGRTDRRGWAQSRSAAGEQRDAIKRNGRADHGHTISRPVCGHRRLAQPVPDHQGGTGRNTRQQRPGWLAYVATDLVSTVTALTEFVEVNDPDIRYGADNDTLSANGAACLIGPGKEVLGKTKSGVWVVETPILPSTYMIAVSTAAVRRCACAKRYAPGCGPLPGESQPGRQPDESVASSATPASGVQPCGCPACASATAATPSPTGYTAPLAVQG